MQRGRAAAIAGAAILALSPLSACNVYKVHDVDRAHFPSIRKDSIMSVTTLSGQKVDFDSPGAKVRGDSLVATIRGSPYAVPVDSVARLQVERRDTPRSMVSSLGGVLAIVGVPTIVIGLSFLITGGVFTD